MAKVFLRSLASGRGSFVKIASVVLDGFEVAVDSTPWNNQKKL